ncbi:MAG: peroxiredoxin family protein, partial [Polyangiaceae bacterium]
MALSPAACAGGEPDARSAGDTGGLVGNPAPDFHIHAVTGARGEVSLGALRGDVVLVDFWGTFCEPCKKSFPKLENLYGKYAGKGLRIIGVSEDDADDEGKIPAFAEAYGAKFALGWDATQVIAKKYNPESMPSTFIIDRRGVVRYAHAGFHDGEEAQLE